MQMPGFCRLPQDTEIDIDIDTDIDIVSTYR